MAITAAESLLLIIDWLLPMNSLAIVGCEMRSLIISDLGDELICFASNLGG
jgi:hypothetical protein